MAKTLKISLEQFQKFLDSSKQTLDALFNETYGQEDSCWIKQVKETACNAIDEAERLVQEAIEKERGKTWDLFWSPEGKKIATVQAKTARAAIRKAPKPYHQYLGEIYAEEVK